MKRFLKFLMVPCCILPMVLGSILQVAADEETIPIRVSIPATPINVTLPSSMDFIFEEASVNAITPEYFIITNNSKARPLTIVKVDVEMKDPSWTYLPGELNPDSYFQALPFDSHEIQAKFRQYYMKRYYESEYREKTCGQNDAPDEDGLCWQLVSIAKQTESLTGNYQLSDTEWNYILKPIEELKLKFFASTGGSTKKFDSNLLNIVFTFA